MDASGGPTHGCLRRGSSVVVGSDSAIAYRPRKITSCRGHVKHSPSIFMLQECARLGSTTAWQGARSSAGIGGDPRHNGHIPRSGSDVALVTSSAREVRMTIDHLTLKQLVQKIFSAAGSHAHEAGRIAHYLIEANLVGHESHGVIRVPKYIEWVRGAPRAQSNARDRQRERDHGRRRWPVRFRPGHGRRGHAHRLGKMHQVRHVAGGAFETRGTWAGSATGPRWPRARARSRSTS